VPAAAVFWVGLRRGWWLDLISFALKHINKGKSKSSKKKSKKKHTKKAASAPDGSPMADHESWVASTAAAGEGGGDGAAAGARTVFNGMKAKLQGSKGGHDSNDAGEHTSNTMVFSLTLKHAAKLRCPPCRSMKCHWSRPLTLTKARQPFVPTSGPVCGSVVILCCMKVCRNRKEHKSASAIR